MINWNNVFDYLGVKKEAAKLTAKLDRIMKKHPEIEDVRKALKIANKSVSKQGDTLKTLYTNGGTDPEVAKWVNINVKETPRAACIAKSLVFEPNETALKLSAAHNSSIAKRILDLIKKVA